MTEFLRIGAVAYDPKVVPIWEGLRTYFQERASLLAEPVLYLSYEAQVHDLLEGKVDVAWNTNLAFLQSEHWSDGRCSPLAMRDTDVGWQSVVFAPAGGAIRRVEDLKGTRLALGSRDSGHAAILPVYFLQQLGLGEGRDYQPLRFNSDVGKHGDTGASELEVLKAVLSGKADAGVVGSPFWETVKAKRLAPEGALAEIWSSAPYNHCMFTARPGLDQTQRDRFVEALLKMSFDNPLDRPVLEAEGLRAWIPPRLDGYQSLRTAAQQQGFFKTGAS